MRLSRGEVFFGIILVFIIVLFWPYSHFDGSARTIQGNHREVAPVTTDVVTQLQPLSHMMELLNHQPVSFQGWTVTFQGVLTSSELDEWQRRMQENATFHSEAEHRFHKVKILNDETGADGLTPYIYVWSGQTPIDASWFKRLETIQKAHFDHLQYNPAVYACLEAIGNATLRDDYLNLAKLHTWLTEYLGAEVVHSVTEERFISLTGYVDTWETALLSSDDELINVQLSARYNELDQTERITLGYPLILKAH